MIYGKNAMIEIISGDLFNSTEKYIVHCCNCITKRSAHLAKTVFEHYPYADIYSGRTTPDTPGSIIIKGNGLDQRFIIAILGQYYPGKPKFPDSALDGRKIREKYFHKALIEISKIPNLESIAFPDHIACGAAGGNWEYYLGTISNFARHVEEQQGARVVIYKLEGKE
jgi:O-acetyl-ADP-ribose deacetylase (regulator of RNase III)